MKTAQPFLSYLQVKRTAGAVYQGTTVQVASQHLFLVQRVHTTHCQVAEVSVTVGPVVQEWLVPNQHWLLLQWSVTQGTSAPKGQSFPMRLAMPALVERTQTTTTSHMSGSARSVLWDIHVKLELGEDRSSRNCVQQVDMLLMMVMLMMMMMIMIMMMVVIIIVMLMMMMVMIMMMMTLVACLYIPHNSMVMEKISKLQAKISIIRHCFCFD